MDVIIDDKFPVDKNGNWSFGQAVDKDELWPLILEKAYAKLYGGYQSIIGGSNKLWMLKLLYNWIGKVSYALSELSGGVADEINLSLVKNNPDNFWKTLIAFYNQVWIIFIII